MLENLQKKWKVSGLQLVLIIATFAIGGSLTGYAARKLMPLFSIDQTWLWIVIYILLVVLLWPLAVIIISVPFGQFSFFIKYIKKIGRRIGIVKSQEPGAESRESNSKRQAPLTTKDLPTGQAGSRLPTHIAIFASGTGSNAQKIIEHFKNNPAVKIALVVCNNPGAGVLKIAAAENIPSLIMEKEKFFRGDAYIMELKEKGIDLIVLAGFMWKLPASLIKAFERKIINIHPALLPKYGGKGMYGHFVHEAVIAAGEKESGITIHYVDEIYDHGKIIFQAACPVLPTDTADLLAQRIHALEHEHYPKIIEKLLIK